MAAVNIHTWTRVTRIDLQNLSVGIGNAAMSDFANWPTSGQGREIKAAAERMMRMLDATFDRGDVQHVFDNLEDVIKVLKQVRSTGYFETNIGDLIYKDRAGRSSPFKNAVDERISKFESFVATHRPERPKPVQHVVRVETQLSSVEAASPESLSDQLRDIAPAQQPGPLQFEVREGVLRLKTQTSSPKPVDAANVRSAHDALKESSSALLQTLEESNCDPRLLEAVSEVNSIVASDADVIRLGLVNFTCDQLVERFQDEIPDIAVARFKGLSVAIGIYVAQFPEWQRFTENAALAEFHQEDVTRTYEFGKQLLPQLRLASGLVDPEVPKSIELVLEALRNPKLSGQRALYGAVRTLENLFAKIFSEFGGVLNAAFSGTKSGIKKGTTLVVATALVLAAAHSASLLSPTAERVVKATWMKQAADLVSKGLE